MLLAALILFLSNPKTIIFIIFVLVLFFGAKRIPELFRGVGQGVREFKDASRPEDQQNRNGYAQQNSGYPQPNQPYNPQQQYPTQNPAAYPPNGYPQQPNYAPQAPNQVPPTAYNNPTDQPAR